MVQIAALQMDASADQAARAETLVAGAAAAGADFALLPELSNHAWLPAREEAALRALAEPADGPAVTGYREMARRHRVNLIAPIFEVEGDLRFSTAFIIGRDGQLLGRYRKNHIPYEPGWREKFYYGPGNDEFPVFEHEGLRFGVLICWDNMYPECARIMGLKGAQAIFAPRATGRQTLARWRAVLQANAAVNHLYVVTANRIGTDRSIIFGGDSMAVGMEGEVLAVVPGDGPGMVVFHVDPDAIVRARAAEPYFENRRPDLYDWITRR